MTEDLAISKVYFVKLGSGEDIFARLIEKMHPTMLVLEDPMIIEPIDHQGGRHLLMTRFLPFVKGPLRVKQDQIAICQEASDIMTQYYQATLDYQTNEGGDERFYKGIERAVEASKRESPGSAKDFNERLLCSAMAVITETKH